MGERPCGETRGTAGRAAPEADKLPSTSGHYLVQPSISQMRTPRRAEGLSVLSTAAKQIPSKLSSLNSKHSHITQLLRVRNLDGSGSGVLVSLQERCQPGLPPSEGLTAVERWPPKVFTHMTVGWRPQFLTTNLSTGLLEHPHNMQLASPIVSDPRERKRKGGRGDRQTEGERTMPSPFCDLVLELIHCHTITFYSLEAVTFEGKGIQLHIL